MSRILVVAAHPDDEILGVGGTIIRHMKEGDEVFVLILGEGQTSRWKNRDEAPVKLLEDLHADSVYANQILGVKQLWFADLPDNRFDQMNLLDITKEIEGKLKLIKPDIVYTHFGDDLNLDHRITFQAVITATRPVDDYSVKEIYVFETLSSTEWNFNSPAFKPNVFVNIENELERKLEAMMCYKNEIRQYPHPRSQEGIKALARFRGLTVALKAAEGFQAVRIIR